MKLPTPLSPSVEAGVSDRGWGAGLVPPEAWLLGLRAPPPRRVLARGLGPDLLLRTPLWGPGPAS